MSMEGLTELLNRLLKQNERIEKQNAEINEQHGELMVMLDQILAKKKKHEAAIGEDDILASQDVGRAEF